MTKIKVPTCKYLLKLYRSDISKVKSLVDKRRVKLRKYHQDFLISEQTLRQWAHLSIRQRAKMFHRTFPEVKISPSTLWRLYKREGIRFKYIQKVKKEINFQNQEYRAMFMRMTELITQAKQAQ